VNTPERRQQRPLAGRRALITGVSRGIGADIARAFAAAGADAASMVDGAEIPVDGGYLVS